jgi:hypothetical protein
MSGIVFLALTLAAAAPDVMTLKRPAEPEWLGIYVLGKKAGWSVTQVAVEKRGGRAVLVGRAETVIQAMVGERTVTRKTFDEKIFEARAGGRLLSFTARREGDGGTRTIEGRCAADSCAVALTGDGRREQRTIPAVRETADDADATRLAAARQETRRGFQLDPDRLREKQVESRFVERRTVAAAGVEVPVAIVEEREVGDRAATVATVADDGRVLEIRVGDSLLAKAEPEAVAKRLDKVDLFGLTRVKLPGPLTRNVPATLRFRFKGLPAAFAEDDPRQEVRPGADGEVVVTVTAAPPAAAERGDAKRAAGLDPKDELLAATPEIDADHPSIRALARRVVRDTPGVYAASRRIADEVYRRLQKTYGSSRDRASEVLAAGKGDCTEHALLFVALARAAGIPARQVHGLVYARYHDGVDALYWHAWPEVRSGPEWIPLDPTFGQPVADATHVALGRGAQVDTMHVLGTVQVVEVRQVQ